MTGVLAQLHGMGYEIRAEEGEIVCRWRGQGAPGEQARALLVELSGRKGEALDALQAEADRPPVFPFDPLPAYPFEVRSRALAGAEVWIIPDGWAEPVPGPAYTHAEIAALARQKVTSEGLKAVHQVKEAFDGEVLR